MAETPLISIKVSDHDVDQINVYHEADCGWRIHGSKDGQPVYALDQLQDDFACLVRVLADYVDEASVWVLSPEMRQLSPFHALALLAEGNLARRPTLFGRC